VSPKDAARRLIQVGPPTYDTICLACKTQVETFGGDELPHRPDCPWLSLPTIVAALEERERKPGEPPEHYCSECGQPMERNQG
jgi:hypothetical protein